MPAFWAASPGPFFAGLLFRVGKIDEQLYSSGITHLVEHLALPAWAPRPGLDWNGWVGPTTTGFWASGEPGEVGAFISEVSRRLHDLPLERLETERGILRAEEASGSRYATGVVAGLRFGAIGIGLLDWLELGLRRLDAASVAAWAAERFTRGNAALWLNGPPPPELRLHLPDGPRIPPPRYDPPPERLPAFGRWGSGGVTVSLWAPRSYALGLAWQSAEQRALERLRYQRGLVYGLSAANSPANKYDAHIVFVAECREQDVDAVRAGLLEVLDEVAERGPTEQEREDWLQRTTNIATDPNEGISSAYGYAEDFLFDDLATNAQVLASMRAVTTAEAAQALREAMPSALLLIPEEGAADPPPPFHPFEAAPTTHRVTGRRFPARGVGGLLRRHGYAILGDDGLGWQAPDGTHVGIAFADCRALMTWQDGSFQIVDPNGSYLLLGPKDVRNAAELAAAVRAAVPSERVIPMDSSSPAG